MDKRRKFNRKKSNLDVYVEKGDVLINHYVSDLSYQINDLITSALQLAPDVAERDSVKYKLIVINALIEAASDIACWGSENNCDEIYERVGAWREIASSIQKLSGIQYL